MNFKKISAAVCSALVCMNSLSAFIGTFATAESKPYAVKNGFKQVNAAKDGDSLLVGDADKDGVIDESDLAALEKLIGKSVSDSNANSDVNSDGKLDQTDLDMLGSFLSQEIAYFPAGIYYDPDAAFITRGEWIHNLATGFEMSAAEGFEPVKFFTDLEDCKYADEINLAANFGVFDVMGEEFNPNEYVTRDFASHTMNYCLGYSNDVSITYDDEDAVYYSGDAQIALDRGWFETENGCFCPSLYVKDAEAQIAFKDMQDAMAGTKIDEDYTDNIVYDDSVIRIDDAANVTMSNGEVLIEGSKTTVKAGDTFVFKLDDIEIIKKAVKVTSAGEDSYIIQTEEAEEDQIVSADSMGYAYVDYDGIEVLEEGIEVELEPDEAESGNTAQRISGQGTFKHTKISLGGKLRLGSTGELSLSGTIKNISIPYALDMKGTTVNRFYLSFVADMEVKGTVKMQSKDDKIGAQKFDLMRVPVAGTAGLGVNVVVSAFVSVSGEISLGTPSDMRTALSTPRQAAGEM